MKVTKKFVVKKEAKNEVITYMEYENLKGLNIKPKHKQDFEDMINVNEMIVINPGLIEKLISKKCKRHFERIIAMLTYACEEDGDDDSSFMLVLDEMERLKNLIINKYKQYMDEKECELLLKKIELLKQEAEERRRYIIESSMNYEKKGKKSR